MSIGELYGDSDSFDTTGVESIGSTVVSSVIVIHHGILWEKLGIFYVSILGTSRLLAYVHAIFTHKIAAELILTVLRVVQKREVYVAPVVCFFSMFYYEPFVSADYSSTLR